MDLENGMAHVREQLAQAEAEIRTRIVGHDDAVRCLLTAVVAGGHVLLEGLPGLGKTLMVRTLQQVLDLSYARIQFTPDLMPADITGTNILETREDGAKAFRFEPGPIFANLLLSDEINRASPKTQSALLQAMQEKEVTVFGRHFPLEEPFITIATQNPIDLEGTYPLPEAQLDRFLFKVIVTSPSLEELKQIADRDTGPGVVVPRAVLDRERLLAAGRLVARIPVAEPVLDFAARLVQATHPAGADAPRVTREFVRFGASPRGLQGLLAAARVQSAREGRFHVSREDIQGFLLPVLRHRIILNLEGELQRIGVDEVLTQIAAAVSGAR
jgi:MoxR-like ATPase